MWHAFVHLPPGAVFKYARVQPFLDVALYALIADAVLDKAHHPFVVHRVEESANVRVQHPTDFALFDGHRDRVQRVMLAAVGPESIGKSQEVFLVNRIEHGHCRPLDYFVFQARDANGALASVRLRDVYSFDGLGAVRAAFQPCAQVFEAFFQGNRSRVFQRTLVEM